MESYLIQLGKTDLLILKTRMEISLKEIQEKAPGKEIYIRGLTESLDQIKYITNLVNDLESENKLLMSRNYDLELINLRLLNEIKDLKINIAIQEEIKKSDL